MVLARNRSVSSIKNDLKEALVILAKETDFFEIIEGELYEIKEDIVKLEDLENLDINIRDRVNIRKQVLHRKIKKEKKGLRKKRHICYKI